jgi:hypothetical protein
MISIILSYFNLIVGFIDQRTNTDNTKALLPLIVPIIQQLWNFAISEYR